MVRSSPLSRPIAAATVLALLFSGCGGDDDDAADEPEVAVDGADGADDADADPADNDDALADEALEELFGDIDQDDLLVPLDYLQGEWCADDGTAWTIEDTTARFNESHDGPLAEVPVIIAFHVGPEIGLVSQTDDEFVVDLGVGDPTTFTRGRC